MADQKIIQKTNEFGETYYYTKHKSGLDIYVIPKDFATNYAVFATKYGAIDNCFKLKGEENFHEVPDGIAHYLEHKMFENEDGVDTFSRFAKYGASANAYTSATMTAYLFSCTGTAGLDLVVAADDGKAGVVADSLKILTNLAHNVLKHTLVGHYIGTCEREVEEYYKSELVADVEEVIIGIVTAAPYSDSVEVSKCASLKQCTATLSGTT